MAGPDECWCQAGHVGRSGIARLVSAKVNNSENVKDDYVKKQFVTESLSFKDVSVSNTQEGNSTAPSITVVLVPERDGVKGGLLMSLSLMWRPISRRE